jgi:hypothetical protein
MNLRERLLSAKLSLGFPLRNLLLDPLPETLSRRKMERLIRKGQIILGWDDLFGPNYDLLRRVR